MRIDRWMRAAALGALVGSMCWAWDQHALAPQRAFDEAVAIAQASEAAASRSHIVAEAAALAAKLADRTGPSQWKAIESAFELEMRARLRIRSLQEGAVPEGPTAGGGFQSPPTIEAIPTDFQTAAPARAPEPDQPLLPLAAGALAAVAALAVRRLPLAAGICAAAIAAAAWPMPGDTAPLPAPVSSQSSAPLALILGASIDWPSLAKPNDSIALAALGSELSRDDGAIALHAASGVEISVAGGANSWAQGIKPAPALATALSTGKPAHSPARCGFLALDCDAWAMPTAGGALVAYDRRIANAPGSSVDLRPRVDRLGLAGLLLVLAALLAYPMRRGARSPNGAAASVD